MSLPVADPNYNQFLNQLFILEGLVNGMLHDLQRDPNSIPDIGLYFAENFQFIPDLYNATLAFGGVSGGNGGGGGGEFDGTELLEAIANIVNSNVNNSTNEIVQRIGQLQNNFIGFVDQGFRALQLNVNSNTQAILDEFTNLIGVLADGIDGALSTQFQGIQQLFINNSNRTEQILDQRVATIQNEIGNSADTIINEVRSLNLSGGGGGSTDVTFNSAWTSAFIVDLLNVLDDFRRAFVNKDFAITVNVPDSTATTPPIWDEDNIPSFPIDLSASSLIEAFSGLNTGLIGDEIGGILDRLNRVVDLFNRMATNQIDNYDDFIDEINDIAGTGTITDTILKGLIFIPALLNGILSASNPFANNIETLARTEALDGLLSRAEISELWIRELESQDYLLDQFKRIGLSEELAKKVIKTFTVQMNEAYLRESYLRNLITQDELLDGMFKLGYSDHDARLIEQTYFRIPPVPDLIRFAVREAYDDTLAEALQLDAGYDVIKDRFERDLRKNGLDPEFGKFYWRAHWNLPSPTQGYEMLHRSIISPQELEQLLKVSDYSPEWIDKLMAISYSPYTRVDIRRMHKVGVLDDDEVLKAYLDIGYDTKKATNLRDFTIALNTTSTEELNKDLTTSQVLRAYVNNIIDEASKDTLLRNIGYNEAEINVLTRIYELNLQADQREDVTRDNRQRIVRSVSKTFIEGGLSEQSARIYLGQAGYTVSEIDQEITTLRIERNLLLQSERIQHIQTSYIEFRIDENQVRQQLAGEGYTPIEENDALILWNTQRKERYKEPTKAELKSWFIAGHITFDECANYLRALGFDNKLVDLYMQTFIDARDPNQ